MFAPQFMKNADRSVGLEDPDGAANDTRRRAGPASWVSCLTPRLRHHSHDERPAGFPEKGRLTKPFTFSGQTVTARLMSAATGGGEKRLSWLTRWATLAVLVVVWELVAGVWLPKARPELATLLPPPSAIAKAAVEMIGSSELLMHLWQSLKRELIAFLFALFAVPLGIAMGWWRWVHEQIDPVEICGPDSADRLDSAVDPLARHRQRRTSSSSFSASSFRC